MKHLWPNSSKPSQPFNFDTFNQVRLFKYSIFLEDREKRPMNAMWNEVKDAIKQHIPGHSFRIWIEPLKLNQSEKGNWVISCPNFFSKKRVQEQYGEIIGSKLAAALGQACRLSFEVSGVKNGKKAQTQREPPIAAAQRSH